MMSQSDQGWNNPKVLSIFAIIFVCGLACGAALFAWYMHARMAPESSGTTVERLASELHMTPEQRKAVVHELDEYAKYYQNIEEERDSVAEQGKQHILSVLDPEQRKRFLEIFKFPSPAPCQQAVSDVR